MGQRWDLFYLFSFFQTVVNRSKTCKLTSAGLENKQLHTQIIEDLDLILKIAQAIKKIWLSDAHFKPLSDHKTVKILYCDKTGQSRDTIPNVKSI